MSSWSDLPVFAIGQWLFVVAGVSVHAGKSHAQAGSQFNRRSAAGATSGPCFRALKRPATVRRRSATTNAWRPIFRGF